MKQRLPRDHTTATERIAKHKNLSRSNLLALAMRLKKNTPSHGLKPELLIPIEEREVLAPSYAFEDYNQEDTDMEDIDDL